ncbi:hypothetical protein CAMRE0001_1488 [Campylobacter rectus RM3267]|uniref:Uncharacterized protein n=1 Tax=Campylobacter rectus RM3267 TaxID=553218 RepID=B9D353_CAMRE|nr:hypothetical protein CAMRE0001_1488 [Campylobacter rectus RM3267]
MASFERASARSCDLKGPPICKVGFEFSGRLYAHRSLGFLFLEKL